MGTKKIKFTYYKPCLLNDTETSVDLSPYFEKISKTQDLYDLDIPSQNSTSLTPTFLKKYPNYKINSGATLQYPLWRLDLSKYRLDLPNIYDKTKRKLEKNTLEKDKFISEETVLLYDSIKNIAVIQVNQHGPSFIQIQSFMNNFINNVDDKITFVPLIRKDAFNRSLKQKSNHSIHVRVINTNTKEFNKYAEETEDNTVRKIAEIASNLRGSEEYDVKLDLSILINEPRTKKGFVKEKFTSAVSSLYQLVNIGAVDQLSTKGYNNDDDKQSVINLIKDVIFDESTFEFDEEHRTISTIKIFDKMAFMYNNKREEFANDE